MGVLFLRVPYYSGDLKRDPSLENYPSGHGSLLGFWVYWVYRVEGLGFRVWELGFRVLGFWVYRVEGLGFRVWCVGFRVLCLGGRV